MNNDRPIIATLHHYKIATTVEMSDDQISRLAHLLEEFAREAGDERPGSVIYGKYDETPLFGFSPHEVAKFEAALHRSIEASSGGES